MLIEDVFLGICSFIAGVALLGFFLYATYLCVYLLYAKFIYKIKLTRKTYIEYLTSSLLFFGISAYGIKEIAFSPFVTRPDLYCFYSGAISAFILSCVMAVIYRRGLRRFLFGEKPGPLSFDIGLFLRRFNIKFHNKGNPLN
jgi:hypothetical protein